MSTKERIINLCSHDITIKDAQGNNIVFEPSGKECRVEVLPKDVHYHAGIALYNDVYGDVENLPGAKEGVIYIVSARVVNALNGSRGDVFAPGRQVPGKSGKVNYSIGLRRKF